MNHKDLDHPVHMCSLISISLFVDSAVVPMIYNGASKGPARMNRLKGHPLLTRALFPFCTTHKTNTYTHTDIFLFISTKNIMLRVLSFEAPGWGKSSSTCFCRELWKIFIDHIDTPCYLELWTAFLSRLNKYWYGQPHKFNPSVILLATGQDDEIKTCLQRL